MDTASHAICHADGTGLSQHNTNRAGYADTNADGNTDCGLRRGWGKKVDRGWAVG